MPNSNQRVSTQIWVTRTWTPRYNLANQIPSQHVPIDKLLLYRNWDLKTFILQICFVSTSVSTRNLAHKYLACVCFVNETAERPSYMCGSMTWKFKFLSFPNSFIRSFIHLCMNPTRDTCMIHGNSPLFISWQVVRVVSRNGVGFVPSS